MVECFCNYGQFSKNIDDLWFLEVSSPVLNKNATIIGIILAIWKIYAFGKLNSLGSQYYY